MTGKILRAVTNAPNQQTVDVLEDILAQARNGDVRFVALAIVTGNGGIRTEWTATDDAPRMLSAIMRLRTQFATADWD